MFQHSKDLKKNSLDLYLTLFTNSDNEPINHLKSSINERLNTTKMLHHPTKHHPTSISHFLALHQNSTATSPTSNSVGLQNDLETSSGTHLDAINTNIGKSFTIAAILGLKKNAAAAMDHHHHGHKDFAVMNLSMAGPHHGAMKANLMENMNNRVPIAFGQHLNQQHLHHPHHHSSSALQSLQQQFQQQQHQQHHANQNMPQFHAKERVKGKGGSMIYVDGFLFFEYEYLTDLLFP